MQTKQNMHEFPDQLCKAMPMTYSFNAIGAFFK